MNQKSIRWKQRFQNFQNSLNLLKRALEIKNPSEVEKGGVIQFFEVTFELAWKTLKDYLESEGFLVNSPRSTIKKAFEIGILTDGELWLNALDDRNMSSHLYDQVIIDEVFERISNQYSNLLNELFQKFESLK